MARNASRQKSGVPQSPPRRQRPDPAGLTIVEYPASVLKRVADEVADINTWLRSVAQRMTQLMAENKGVGLAGPQVGIPLRLFVMSPEGDPKNARVIINPIITDATGQVDGEEGCLSLPDIRTQVTRHAVLTLESYDLDGQKHRETLADWQARIVQHETDHLDGILIIDRISPGARLGLRQKLRALENNS